MKVTKKKCEKILAPYRFGKVRSVVRLTSGFTNSNFKVATKKGNYVLRFFRAQSLEEIQYEIKLYAKLKEEKFPAAYPVPDHNADYIQHLSKGYAVVYPFIEGKEPLPRKKTVRGIARAMARLHSIKGWKKLQRPNPYGIEGCQAVIKKFKQAKYQHPELFDFVRKETALLQKPLSTKLPKGFIHGDLYTDNTLFKGKKLMAMLDFECACTDSLLIDVGTTINGFCFKKNRLDEKLYTLMIKEYQKIRPLTKQEIKLLPYYVHWGSFIWVCWHLEMALNNKAPENLKRAKYLMERIKNLSVINGS